MKRLFLFALALIAFASCSKDDAIENESIDGKEYVVNLGFSGEIEVSHSLFLIYLLVSYSAIECH